MVGTTSHKNEFKFGDTSAVEPIWAKKELVQKLGERTGEAKALEDQVQGFRLGLKREVARNRNVKLAVETCVHCGACLNACPTYISSGDIRNSPVGRADLIRKVAKADSLAGRALGDLAGGKKLDESGLKDVATYYYQCLECRRCGEICPFGIDQADLTRTVRSVLLDVGIVARYPATVIDNAEKTGNNMGLPPPALKATLDFVKEEIEAEKGVKVDVKVDEPAQVLLVPPSADFFSNLDTLKGYIYFLHSTGVDYTFTTEHTEVANFGLFIDEKHLRIIGDHLVGVAEKLGVSYVVAGECGHGWRAFKNYVIPELEKRGIEGLHIFHLVIAAMKAGAVVIDPEKNGDRAYVYQDPCNYARGGDLIDEPRYILRSVVKNYQDSPHSRERTWCCGGGGGLLTDELIPLRLEYAKLWYNDALSVSGAHVVRPCAICKAQLNHTLPLLNKAQGRSVTYSGMMDLVYTSIPAGLGPKAPLGGGAQPGGALESRRTFLELALGASAALMAAGVAAAARPLLFPPASPSGSGAAAASFPRVKVANVSDLSLNAPLAFSYPLGNEPNILVKVGQRAAGGVGPDGDIVAFSAICQHQGCHWGYQATGTSPSCSSSFKAAGPVGYCCCHDSVYDLVNGGKVIGGPAPRPEPQVLLEVDGTTGDIYATGMGPPAIFGHHTGSSDVSYDLQGGTPVA
ncbi:MAG: arsenate reductase (azurin) small subunit [Nitrososphaerota archaeon]|nr:arsenate reductase (azurin) small subunit [Nitrososphaerota archaeon]